MPFWALLLLAATAKVNGMTLVTRNIVDVADLGANVLNPFKMGTMSMSVGTPESAAST